MFLLRGSVRGAGLPAGEGLRLVGLAPREDSQREAARCFGLVWLWRCLVCCLCWFFFLLFLLKNPSTCRNILRRGGGGEGGVVAVARGKEGGGEESGFYPEKKGKRV